MRSLALLLVPALALSACSKDKPPSAKDVPNLGSGPALILEEGQVKPNVVATISVDWEGAYLSDAGLQALAEFRNTWKSAPLTHFICPAYFTQGAEDPALVARVKSNVLDGDEVGLHMHSWFSLAEKAGVAPRAAPNFYADESPLTEFPNGDKGYEVALGVYGPKELKKLILHSAALLESNGLGTPTSFRSGGYVAPASVLAAVRAAGMHVDSSAAWSPWFREAQGSFQSEIARQWPNMQELTQPYGIDTPSGVMVEVPNTGSFAEYATADEMIGHLQRAAAQSTATGSPIYVNFGVHQESADEFIGRISTALKAFEAQSPGVLSFTTVTSVAQASMGE